MLTLQVAQKGPAHHPNTDIGNIRINHVGNALSAYIDAAFATKPSAWDRYVGGDDDALTTDQKRGAFIFFGKGRCAVCHSGPHFSDFQFHSLAIPQNRVGKHARNVDYGRASATSRGQDRFKFRTPPLCNVALSTPYGHNGVFASISAIVEHHLNPIPKLCAAQQTEPAEAAHVGRVLASRSNMLAEMGLLGSRDVDLLVSFLTALSSPTQMSDALAIPASVPSGNQSFFRR